MKCGTFEYTMISLQKQQVQASTAAHLLRVLASCSSAWNVIICYSIGEPWHDCMCHVRMLFVHDITGQAIAEWK